MSIFEGLFHPDLAAKFSALFTLSGRCNDDLTTVTLCFNANDEKSVAVTIHYKNRKLFFADHEKTVSNLHPLLLHLRVPRVDATECSDGVLDIPQTRSLLRSNENAEKAGSKDRARRLKANTTAVARKFRLALTTAEFSALRGNTVQGVLTWIAKALARVSFSRNLE